MNTFELQIGTPDTIFSDDAENGITNWIAEYEWGTVEESHQGIYSFTDSPSGQYQGHQTSSIIMAQGLDLSFANDAYLEFWTTWELERGLFNIPGDFAQVEVKEHPDSAWKALEDRYTVLGAGDGVQPLGEPGYVKTMDAWVKERMALTEFAGSSDVKVRFKLSTDNVIFTNYGDGWYIDDIVLSIFRDSASRIADENSIPGQFTLSQNYPNPFNPSTKIKFTLPQSEKISIEIFSLLGQKIGTLVNKKMPAGSHEIEFNAKDLPSGVYLYRIQAGDYINSKKMLLLR
jgi:hypothetical protein